MSKWEIKLSAEETSAHIEKTLNFLSLQKDYTSKQDKFVYVYKSWPQLFTTIEISSKDKCSSVLVCNINTSERIKKIIKLASIISSVILTIIVIIMLLVGAFSNNLTFIADNALLLLFSAATACTLAIGVLVIKSEMVKLENKITDQIRTKFRNKYRLIEGTFKLKESQNALMYYSTNSIPIVMIFLFMHFLKFQIIFKFFIILFMIIYLFKDRILKGSVFKRNIQIIADTKGVWIFLLNELLVTICIFSFLTHYISFTGDNISNYVNKNREYKTYQEYNVHQYRKTDNFILSEFTKYANGHYQKEMLRTIFIVLMLYLLMSILMSCKYYFKKLLHSDKRISEEFSASMSKNQIISDIDTTLFNSTNVFYKLWVVSLWVFHLLCIGFLTLYLVESRDYFLKMSESVSESPIHLAFKLINFITEELNVWGIDFKIIYMLMILPVLVHLLIALLIPFGEMVNRIWRTISNRLTHKSLINFKYTYNINRLIFIENKNLNSPKSYWIIGIPIIEFPEKLIDYENEKFIQNIILHEIYHLHTMRVNQFWNYIAIFTFIGKGYFNLLVNSATEEIKADKYSLMMCPNEHYYEQMKKLESKINPIKKYSLIENKWNSILSFYSGNQYYHQISIEDRIYGANGMSVEPDKIIKHINKVGINKFILGVILSFFLLYGSFLFNNLLLGL